MLCTGKLRLPGFDNPAIITLESGNPTYLTGKMPHLKDREQFNERLMGLSVLFEKPGFREAPDV